jgi:hypothetical protein
VDPREAASFAAEEFAWAVGALAVLHRLPFEPQLLLKQFPPPYDFESVLLAAQALALVSAARPLERVSAADLPVLLPIRAGGSIQASSDVCRPPRHLQPTNWDLRTLGRGPP